MAALAFVSLSGCADDEGAVRMLDRICQSELQSSAPNVPPLEACTVTGDAEQTSGITSDSIGYSLGPRYGSLRIRLRAIDEAAIRLGAANGALRGGSWSLDALLASARSEGSTLVRDVQWATCQSCPDDATAAEFPLSEDYDWEPVVDGLPALTVPYWESSIPDDSWLVLTGADVEIADIRLPGLKLNEYAY